MIGEYFHQNFKTLPMKYSDLVKPSRISKISRSTGILPNDVIATLNDFSFYKRNGELDWSSYVNTKENWSEAFSKKKHVDLERLRATMRAAKVRDAKVAAIRQSTKRFVLESIRVGL